MAVNQIRTKSAVFALGYKGYCQTMTRMYSQEKTFQHVLISVAGSKSNVGIIKMNRLRALNSLSLDLVRDIAGALDFFEDDNNIKTIIITGSERCFAAGADIKELSSTPYHEVLGKNFLSHWDRVSETRKPLIAAVSGIALGGGCELAMMCDIIYAADNAKFGQPEIKLGLIPGAGGTQRLIRSIGKSKAMEWILTGDTYTAEEAAVAGLVSRVFPVADLLPKSIEVAEKIGNFSGLTTQVAKEAVNAANNTTLSEGLRFEKRVFHGLFGTNDFREGVTAFLGKRAPKFTDT